VSGSSKRVRNEKRRGLLSPRRRCIDRDFTVSSCSWHAADPLLADKDGKQEAEEDEREREQHGIPDRCGYGPGPNARAFNSLTRDEHGCQGGRPLDLFTCVHNNPAMNAAPLLPVTVILNLAGSTGATG